MISVTWPAIVVLLIPVIVIEGMLSAKWLKLPTWQAMKANAASNVTSTLIGIPVAWALMLAVEIGLLGPSLNLPTIEKWKSPLADVVAVVLTSAWLRPVEHKDFWMIGTATLVLLFPFFFASYWIEYFVVRRMIGKADGEPPNLAYPRVKIAVRNANLVTYGVMFLATCVWLAISLRHR